MANEINVQTLSNRVLLGEAAFESHQDFGYFRVPPVNHFKLLKEIATGNIIFVYGMNVINFDLTAYEVLYAR